MGIFVGIDIGMKFHHCFFIDQDGKKIMDFRFNNNDEGFKLLFENLLKYKKTDIDTISLEATGHYWYALYEKLLKEYSQIKVFNPILTSATKNINIRGIKSDPSEAKRIANLPRLSDVLASRIPEGMLAELRDLSRFRRKITKQLNSVILYLQSILDVIFPEWREISKNGINTTLLTILKETPFPEQILKLGKEKLLCIIRKASKNRLGKEFAEKVYHLASITVGCTTKRSAYWLKIIDSIKQIEMFKSQISELDNELSDMFKSEQSLLQSIPGIGKVNSAAILSEIGDLKSLNNNNGQAIVALAGLDPKVKESGKYQGKRKISKRGSRYLRAAIYESVFVAVFTHSNKQNQFRMIYLKHKGRGKKHREALLAACNKMCHVIYSVLKYQNNYNEP